MLKSCTDDDARRIADLAKTARQARDRILSEVAEGKFGEPRPMRGQHDPASDIGLEPLPHDHPARVALEQAVASLSDEALWELQALAWIGRGDYGAGQWETAVSAASRSPDASAQALADIANLHEEITKGLYEIATSFKGAAPLPSRSS